MLIRDIHQPLPPKQSPFSRFLKTKGTSQIPIPIPTMSHKMFSRIRHRPLLIYSIYCICSLQIAAALSEAECIECGDILQTLGRFAVQNRAHMDRGCRLDDCTELRFACQVGSKMRLDEDFEREGVIFRCQRFDGVNLEIQRVTDAPTALPTREPSTRSPTREPTTRAPTRQPTSEPTTRAPTALPTNPPTSQPTRRPTREPTTSSPTREPTTLPTSAAPSAEPTLRPSTSPTTFTPTTVESLTAFAPSGDEAAVAAGASVAGVVAVVLALLVVRRRRRMQRTSIRDTPRPVLGGTPSTVFATQAGSHQKKPPGFFSNIYRQSMNYLYSRHRQEPQELGKDIEAPRMVPTALATMPPPAMGRGRGIPRKKPLRNAHANAERGRQRRPPRERHRSPRGRGRRPVASPPLDRTNDGVETPPPAPPRKRRKKMPEHGSSQEEEGTPPPAPPRVRRMKKQGESGEQPQRPKSPFPPHRWVDDGEEDYGDDDDDDEVYEDVKF